MLRLPIDHVVLPVADLAAAGAAFEAAGFLVTPETRHSAAMGTANRCIMLDGSYIELIGIVVETPANLPWRRRIAAGPGIGGLAFSTGDIAEASRHLQEKGVRTEAPRHFSRMTDDGELSFTVIRIDPGETPGLQCLVCQHHTRERLWRDELLLHPNGARSLDAVALPGAAVLARFADESGVAVQAGDDALVLRGTRPARHDLRAICGAQIEVICA